MSQGINSEPVLTHIFQSLRNLRADQALEQKLSANLTYEGVTVSADVGKNTRNALTENKAEVTVRIVTSGMGHGPIELGLQNSSKDVEAVNEVY